MSVNKERFQDLEWSSFTKTITIAGLGGIGSWLALFLSRIGHNLLLVDYDTIEKVNLAGQFYPEDHVGKTKVSSLEESIRSFSPGCRFLTDNKKIEEKHVKYSDIICMCFDNMDARKQTLQLFKNRIAKINENTILVDGRMQAEYFEVFLVTKDNVEQYEKEYMFDDDEVADLPCSAKATTHCGAMCAGFMTSLINNHITNIHVGDTREVPLKASMHLPLLMQDLEYSHSIVCQQ